MIELDTIDSYVRRAAAQRGSETALCDAPNRADFFGGEPRRLSWAEVDAAIDDMAGRLESLGTASGSAVGVQLPNIVELVITILACARTGAVAVPFPIQHRTHELRSGIALAGIDLIVTGARPDRPDQLDSVAAVASEFDDVSVAVIGDGDAPAGMHPVELGFEASPVADAPAADALVSICWTSGTTGTPKGVPRTNAMWLATGRTQTDQLGLTAEDRMLCPFPIVNMAGIGGMVLPWAITGARLVLHQPLDLPVFLDQIGRESITYTVSPPPLLNMLLRDGALLERIDLSCLRAICSGSAPLDPWMVEGWEAKGIEIINAFGSNEGAALLSNRTGVPDVASRARFFPRPDPTVIDVRLVDLATEEEIVEPGRLGELRFRGPTVFAGYLGSDGGEFDDAGYFRSGDLFEWVEGSEAPQLMRFVDRAKDIIIRGGTNVSAAEVEGLLSTHPAVAECAVVASPDPDLGERVGVFIVAAPQATLDLGDLVSHLRELDIASYKLPERMELVDALPRNPVGKVVKAELRARWSTDAGS